MIRRPVKNRLNRNRPDPSQTRNPTDVVATPSISGGDALLTFTTPVSLNGIPAITNEGVLPVSATRPTPLTVLLNYAAAVVATDILVIPNRDPAIRTAQGGYVSPLTFEFP